MLLFIVYTIGIAIYISLPLKYQIIALLLNTLIPDNVPYIDEIIMYSSTLKKLIKAGTFLSWVERNKKAVIIICSVLVLLFVVWFITSI